MIWKRLYGASECDVGTLFHIHNVINRRNVVKKPKNDVNACEDFFLLVVESYIIAAAMEVFHMSSIEDHPSTEYFPKGAADLKSHERRALSLLGVRQITAKFIHLSYPASVTPEKDHILAYAKEVMSLGVLLMEFNDAIREGDGQRILRCWKFFLPTFKATNRTNYSLQPFISWLSITFFSLTGCSNNCCGVGLSTCMAEVERI